MRVVSRSQSPRRGHRLSLQQLEDRTLLAANVVPDELLVRFESGFNDADRAALRTQLGAELKDNFGGAAIALGSAGGALELWRLPQGMGVDNAERIVEAVHGVLFAEPNYLLTAQVVSNDTYYVSGQLWGMYSDDVPAQYGPPGTTNTYGTHAERAWDAGYIGSNTVYVGIIDEGFQYAHPDLDANSWTNPFDPIDGVDNDGNGRIDDFRGWDFWFNDSSTYDGLEDDHGTHVAGTIGGEGGNAAGVAGVNWNVQMISAKFLGPAGGTTAGAINSVNYLTDLKTRHGLNIVATNNSWGGGGYSQNLHDAIIRGAKAGILFVAAAGNANSDNDSKPAYPTNYSTLVGTSTETAASYEAVISVASITNTGARSSFSNYGATTVDLGAPGSNIMSTVPDAKYALYNGTSMATPHVAGAAALYASAYPGASAEQIRGAILSGVTATPSLNGITVTGGRLNVWKALQIQPNVDITIDNVSRAEGSGSTTTFTFTVTLGSPAATTITVDFATNDGSATAGSGDYTSTNGTLTFTPGQTFKTIQVLVDGDFTQEPDETFVVNLTNATGGGIIADGQGLGTIIDDDNSSMPELSIDMVMKYEGHLGFTPFTFFVTLSAPSGSTVTVSYNTLDGAATVADSDYVPIAGILTFDPGVTSLPLTVSVDGDFRPELAEPFYVQLSNAVNATIVIPEGVGIILNDDGPNGGGGGGDGIIGRGGSGGSILGGRGGSSRSAGRGGVQGSRNSSGEQYAAYLFPDGAGRRDNFVYESDKFDILARRRRLVRI